MKDYDKLKRNTEQIILEMKNEEDSLDKEIQSLAQKKVEEVRKSVVAEERIQNLKQEVEQLKQLLTHNGQINSQNGKNIQNEIYKHKDSIVQVESSIWKNE